MLKGWQVSDNTIILDYDEGELYVSQSDFNRAFGCIVSSDYETVKRDFHKPDLMR